MTGPLDWLLERFTTVDAKPFMVWNNQSYSYAWLLERIELWRIRLGNLGHRQVVTIEADYSPDVVALMLVLAERSAVIVPLTASVEVHKREFTEIAEVQLVIQFNSSGEAHFYPHDVMVKNTLTKQLLEIGEAGLVLFSSGSTGKSKAVLHNLSRLFEKFKVIRHSFVTLTFLLLDHIGGFNTLLYTLSNTGTAVTVLQRTPAEVCRAIEQHRVELLPTSPTFLNLLILSEAYSNYDLSSLRRITYGTEVMPQYTLTRLHELLPQVELQQTYGLSELGILRSQSRDSNSLWVRLGGEGFETKIQDGILWIRAQSAMLGYLNAPSPFDADGWLNTGDAVEVDGNYVHILGRFTEIINVGGLKVYPAEVESVLMEMPNVVDVTVSGESNALTGHIVVARFNLAQPEATPDLRRRMREYCRERLANYKIPAKIEVLSEEQYSQRFKKMRRSSEQE
jgi:long-chain acyl-CoA synthetase